MFFKTDIKQKDGRDYRYYRLCESYRDGRHIRNRTLLCVGDLESILPAEKIGFLGKRINQVYYEGKTFMISSLRDDRVETLCMEYVGLLREAQSRRGKEKRPRGLRRFIRIGPPTATCGRSGPNGSAARHAANCCFPNILKRLAGIRNPPPWP